MAKFVTFILLVTMLGLTLGVSRQGRFSFNFNNPSSSDEDQKIIAPAPSGGEKVSGLRPYEERACLDGLVLCEHGYCSSSNDACICDKGWVGLFCTDKCTLECQNNGSCLVISGQAFCNCPYNYTGQYCEIPRT